MFVILTFGDPIAVQLPSTDSGAICICVCCWHQVLMFLVPVISTGVIVFIRCVVIQLTMNSTGDIIEGAMHWLSVEQYNKRAVLFDCQVALCCFLH